jgi:hypothetical protein
MCSAISHRLPSHVHTHPAAADVSAELSTAPAPPASATLAQLKDSTDIRLHSATMSISICAYMPAEAACRTRPSMGMTGAMLRLHAPLPQRKNMTFMGATPHTPTPLVIWFPPAAHGGLVRDRTGTHFPAGVAFEESQSNTEPLGRRLAQRLVCSYCSLPVSPSWQCFPGVFP